MNYLEEYKKWCEANEFDEETKKELLSIKDGSASIIEASCPDLLCVKQKEIREAGESIICLPNKLVIRVINEGETTVDGVAD